MGPAGRHFNVVGVWLFANNDVQFKTIYGDISEWAEEIIASDNTVEEIFAYLSERINSITIEREEVPYEAGKPVEYYYEKYCK